jgi:ABC-type multidrug transport system permease subunit
MGHSADRRFRHAVELTRRSFESMIRDPIVLGLRIGIYGGISLVLGVLFYGLDDDVDAHSVLISRTALLYFIIAFCSSMSVAAIPFSIVERAIVEKEVRNHRFHPAFYHVSQALASLPACLVLSILGACIDLNR